VAADQARRAALGEPKLALDAAEKLIVADA
jgi:hypothetical protein